MFSQVRTLYFDFDGTLNNSITLYAPAFRKGYAMLVEAGAAPQRQWTDEEIAYWLGFSSKEMWASFMPNLDPALRDKASRAIGQEMQSLIDQGKAYLYPGALETLKHLKDNHYQLVFLSNCSIGYMEKMTRQFGLDAYFDAMYCAEQYDNQPKYEILSQIKGQYNAEQVMIGDRFQDVEAGKRNGLMTIGCLYGYGSKEELMSTDHNITSIIDLKSIFK